MMKISFSTIEMLLNYQSNDRMVYDDDIEDTQTYYCKGKKEFPTRNREWSPLLKHSVYDLLRSDSKDLAWAEEPLKKGEYVSKGIFYLVYNWRGMLHVLRFVPPFELAMQLN